MSDVLTLSGNDRSFRVSDRLNVRYIAIGEQEREIEQAALDCSYVRVVGD
jgi:hypothetical protein